MTTLTTREASQDFSRAKRAAEEGPVFITEYGKPAIVLITHKDWLALTKQAPTLHELLADKAAGKVRLEPEALENNPKAARFT